MDRETLELNISLTQARIERDMARLQAMSITAQMLGIEGPRLEAQLATEQKLLAEQQAQLAALAAPSGAAQ